MAHNLPGWIQDEVRTSTLPNLWITADCISFQDEYSSIPKTLEVLDAPKSPVYKLPTQSLLYDNQSPC